MKKIKTLKRFYVLALLMCFGISQGWANDVTYSATVNAHSETASGKVYASKESNDPNPSDYDSDVSANDWTVSTPNNTKSFDFYLFAKPENGYNLMGWKKGADGNIVEQNNTGYHKITISTGKDATTEDWYAVFGTPVTIGQYKYATYVAPCDLDFSDSGVTAYAVSSANIANSIVILTSQTKVPAGTALVVRANEAETYTIKTTTNAPECDTDMEVSAEDITYNKDDDYDYYYLGVNNGNACFKKLTSGKIAAGKCFFKVVKDGNGGAKPLVISLGDDDVTGISSIENETTEKDNAVYNLAGQRVENPVRGKIYIKNGKKYIFK